MTRTLYDSTTVEDIPKHAKMVAGYVDGRYITVPKLKRRFPHATVVTITVLGKPGAMVCDTEPGNIGIDGAAQWAANEVKAGRKPTLYCMKSQWADVKREVRRLGITSKVSYWVADYDNDPKIPDGAVAKQYADPATHGEGHFDVSSVRAHWPGVDPEPKGTPVSKVSLVLAKHLLKRVGKRDKPPTKGREVFVALHTQLGRVLTLGEPDA